MQSELLEADKNPISSNNSNVANEMDGIQQENVVSKDDYQNFIENDEDLENNFSDSDDGDQFINSFSSPSNSSHDDELRWYAYRGRLGINFLESNDVPNNHNFLLQNENHQPQINNNNAQQNQQEEEETDFLEMDFEPDTNSEIENDDYALRNGHNNLPENNQLPVSQDFSINHLNEQQQHENHHRNTGAKPKQFSLCRNLKSPKQTSPQITDGDNTFRITNQLYNNSLSSQHIDDDSYNIGASCSRYNLSSERPYHRSHLLDSDFMKPHKSPCKSSTHNQNKQQRLHEEQNDFLFEIEPIKPRNSVTIYTSNCDEKILMDALTSLKIKPDREIILNYFHKSRTCCHDLGLIDYIIYMSKKNCNYLKLIELIEESCINDYYDEYGIKRFDINFYALDFFSTTPEMIEIEVSEIVKRWNPQTDLTPLVNIKNKYFIQTNVLGKLVNIIRRLNDNQKAPLNIFRDDETIKIPQFTLPGYITITMRHPT